MPLEQIVFFQIRQIDQHQVAPIIGRHDPIERVLVAEKEAQRHAGGFRQVQKKRRGRGGAQGTGAFIEYKIMWCLL